MKKLFKRLTILSLCACMLIGTAVTSNAATLDSDIAFVLGTTSSSPRYYLNIYATSASNVTNGTALTTWNTRDSGDTQNFKLASETTGTETYHVLYMRGSSSMVVSYNRNTTAPIMWQKNNDNPYTEYGMGVDPYFHANYQIYFSELPNMPYLIANGSKVTYGSQYGYRVNTASDGQWPSGSTWSVL